MSDYEYEHTEDNDREYLKMQALYYPDGRPPEPQTFWWNDRCYKAKLLNYCRSASLKNKKTGIRYTCMVMGKVQQIFFDTANMQWYWQRDIQEESIPEREVVRTWHQYDTEYKQYVLLLAQFSPNGGKPTPVSLWWEDGRQYDIEPPTEVKRAASQKAGAIGIRYTCIVNGKTVMIYYEDDNQRWFVERKEPRKCADGIAPSWKAK